MIIVDKITKEPNENMYEFMNKVLERLKLLSYHRGRVEIEIKLIPE